MNKLISLLIEAFLILCGFIILTAGDPFLSSELQESFRSHPRYHRLLISVVASLGIFLFAVLHRKYNRTSGLFSFVRKINLSFLTLSAILFVFFSILFAYSSYIRHKVFASSFDFAIFSQAIWNTAHGSFLYSSIKGGVCLLGDHVSPFLILFSPLFSFEFRPELLLVLQAIGAVSGIFPLFLLAKKVLNEDSLAFLFVISFLLYLPLRNSIRFDFHPEIFAISFLLWAFYWLITNRLMLSSLALLLTLSTKEVACLPVAFVGLYALVAQRKFSFGLFWVFLSVALFFAEVKWIAPHFSGAPYFYLSGNYEAWKSEGASAFVKYLLQPSTFNYLKKIFLPVGLLSYLSPTALLLCFPALFQNLTARNELTRSIFFQYTAYLTPFVFISTVFGLKNLIHLAGKKFPTEKVKIVAAYWLIGWSLLMSGVSEFHVIGEYQKQDTPHWEYVRTYLKQIPSSVSVRTHEFFAPHLANRKELHIFENNHPKEGGSAKAQNTEYIILDRNFLSNENAQIAELKNRGYIVQHEHDGFYVLIRNSPK